MLRVRGTTAAGASVYVRDGAMEGGGAGTAVEIRAS
uniref:Uncharacterized protein n=1 Tax=blood disease bacterium R229 TaxID=741978 RepID=G2ZRV8_9RALS|nr:hypothetical protein BDB_160007 [blood disease bacterium R229]